MKKINIIWVLASLVITAVFFLPIFSADYREYFVSLIQSYPLFAPVTIIFFRFIGVVLAPLPGAPIAFASMAILPWPTAMAYNFIGSELGAITAFFIARHFREPAVRYFAPLNKIHTWQDKISQKKQFWGFVGLRSASIVFFDFVSYAAGLSKLPFKTFIIATIITDIPANLIFFYLGGLAVEYSILVYGVLTIIFIITVFILSRVNLKKVEHEEKN